MKIYTKEGDLGKTKTINGIEVEKDDCLIEVNGLIDSLQAQLDKVSYGLNIIPDYSVHIIMVEEFQGLLWMLGGEISGKKPKDPISDYIIDDGWTKILEEHIDDFKLELDGFQRFKNPIAMDINEARIKTRELERVLTEYLRTKGLRPEIYKFINRLSDYFFALSVSIEQKYE